MWLYDCYPRQPGDGRNGPGTESRRCSGATRRFLETVPANRRLQSGLSSTRAPRRPVPADTYDPTESRAVRPTPSSRVGPRGTPPLHCQLDSVPSHRSLRLDPASPFVSRGRTRGSRRQTIGFRRSRPITDAGPETGTAHSANAGEVIYLISIHKHKKNITKMFLK